MLKRKKLSQHPNADPRFLRGVRSANFQKKIGRLESEIQDLQRKLAPLMIAVNQKQADLSQLDPLSDQGRELSERRIRDLKKENKDFGGKKSQSIRALTRLRRAYHHFLCHPPIAEMWQACHQQFLSIIDQGMINSKLNDKLQRVLKRLNQPGSKQHPHYHLWGQNRGVLIRNQDKLKGVLCTVKSLLPRDFDRVLKENSNKNRVVEHETDWEVLQTLLIDRKYEYMFSAPLQPGYQQVLHGLVKGVFAASEVLRQVGNILQERDANAFDVRSQLIKILQKKELLSVCGDVPWSTSTITSTVSSMSNKSECILKLSNEVSRFGQEIVSRDEEINQMQQRLWREGFLKLAIKNGNAKIACAEKEIAGKNSEIRTVRNLLHRVEQGNSAEDDKRRRVGLHQ